MSTTNHEIAICRAPHEVYDLMYERYWSAQAARFKEINVLFHLDQLMPILRVMCCQKLRSSPGLNLSAQRLVFPSLLPPLSTP